MREKTWMAIAEAPATPVLAEVRMISQILHGSFLGSCLFLARSISCST